MRHSRQTMTEVLTDITDHIRANQTVTLDLNDASVGFAGDDQAVICSLVESRFFQLFDTARTIALAIGYGSIKCREIGLPVEEAAKFCLGPSFALGLCEDADPEGYTIDALAGYLARNPQGKGGPA